MPTSPSPLPAHQGTNPHTPQPTSLVALGKSLWRHRQLILQMTRRKVLGRYKGSFMGLAWSFFTPLLMPAVASLMPSFLDRGRGARVTIAGQAFHHCLTLSAAIGVSDEPRCSNEIPAAG